MSSPCNIAVIGLGYVGLPLAVAFARHFPVIGYDISKTRIAELNAGNDRTGEIGAAVLGASSPTFVSSADRLAGADIFLITVPTPVDDNNEPDLGAVKSACRTIGEALGKGAIVVLESTVYPGVTEDVCGPELERASGLKCGADFFLGYSPERINPGDSHHSLEEITKVVSGQTPEIAQRLAEIYGVIVNGDVFIAANIRTAEAAKVIENAQRDINIAFINEVTVIFNRLEISVDDVLDASATKWNFLDFKPGLVGGHCIGVDPFYLAHCAENSGHHPEVILAGRRINDKMGAYLADWIAARIAATATGAEAAKILVLGLTFKENLPDLRNTKVIDLINGLGRHGHLVDVHDPLAGTLEARELHGVELKTGLDGLGGYDCLVGAVAHDSYRAFTGETFSRLLRPGGLVADIKGVWRHVELPGGLGRWRL
ncbi:MAG TPA: nucleotide sugar dehydrogenase [Rhodospirillales bacterium]|jgi:UDP-N-acetyl-D-galactosamine dehydrogenase|nr:nucleotide sugar dehydrogenase [Rhodospirillales bacterium]